MITIDGKLTCDICRFKITPPLKYKLILVDDVIHRVCQSCLVALNSSDYLSDRPE